MRLSVPVSRAREAIEKLGPLATTGRYLGAIASYGCCEPNAGRSDCFKAAGVECHRVVHFRADLVAVTGVAFSGVGRSRHVETNKVKSIIWRAYHHARDGGHERCERGLQTTRSDQRRCRRKALQVGLWSLARQRRVGVDAWLKRRTQYRILVYLLADKAR